MLHSDTVITRKLKANPSPPDSVKPLSSKITMLSYDKLQFEQKINEGSEATIHLGTYHGEKVVFKVFDKEFHLIKNKDNHAIEQASLLAHFASPYIIGSYGAAIAENKPPCIVLEYMRNNSLNEVLQNHRLSPMRHLTIANQIAQALCMLHSKGYVYNDLKPGNILCDENYNVKLADFGLVTQGDAKSDRGTVGYIAPEVLNKFKTSQMSDVYSYGVLLLAIISNYDDYFAKAIMEDSENYTERQVCMATIDGELHRNMMELVKKHKKRGLYPSFILDIIEDCIQHDPTKRPTMESIIKSFDSYFIPKQLIEGDNIPTRICAIL